MSTILSCIVIDLILFENLTDRVDMFSIRRIVDQSLWEYFIAF